ncbi:MAG: hypothetical protein V1870_02420 [Candidatus Aenigmatarchaeota archaeon]
MIDYQKLEKYKNTYIDSLRKQLNNATDRLSAADTFFSFSLYPFYLEGINLEDEEGHVLYRLSDTLNESHRKGIKIAPSDLKNTKDKTIWYSLEDWRNAWKRRHNDIPIFSFR